MHENSHLNPSSFHWDPSDLSWSLSPSRTKCLNAWEFGNIVVVFIRFPTGTRVWKRKSKAGPGNKSRRPVKQAIVRRRGAAPVDTACPQRKTAGPTFTPWSRGKTCRPPSLQSHLHRIQSLPCKAKKMMRRLCTYHTYGHQAAGKRENHATSFRCSQMQIATHNLETIPWEKRFLLDKLFKTTWRITSKAHQQKAKSPHRH